MAVDLINTGISILGDIPWGSHICLFYETTQDFNVPEASESASHDVTWGLLSMQERVRFAGGTLTIKSVPGQGTEIHALFLVEGQVTQ